MALAGVGSYGSSVQLLLRRMDFLASSTGEVECLNVAV